MVKITLNCMHCGKELKLNFNEVRASFKEVRAVCRKCGKKKCEDFIRSSKVFDF